MPTLTTASQIRSAVGRKSPEDIRVFVAEHPESDSADLALLTVVADRLQAAGFCTLNDVTDDEFDDIIAA